MNPGSVKEAENQKLYSFEVRRESGEDVLYINYLGALFIPNLAESGEVMARTIDVLIQTPNVSRIVFMQQRNYNYDFQETSMLMEIAQLHSFFLNQEKILSYEKLSARTEDVFRKRYSDLFSFLFLLKSDPIQAFFEIKKLILEEKISLEKNQGASGVGGYVSFLEKILAMLSETKLIKRASNYFDNYQKGSRQIYYKLFKADVIPNFTFTRLVADLPEDADIIDQYKIKVNDYEESVVTILKKDQDAKMMYHLNPPENTLKEDYHVLLNLARGVLMEHQPKAEEFTDTNRIRQVFFNIAKDLLRDLSSAKGIALDFEDLNLLASILVRHTIGFGLIEVLLQDDKLQDIMLNAPIPLTNIYVKHQDYDECYTNVLPSQEDIDSWAAKFRMISGRPLDEANPILDSQLEIGNMRSRIAIIQQPLSPDGLSYALRRHRENPWTLPLFVKNKMLNSFTAGLMSFLIDGSRTLLVAGTRSSGKTSLLGSLMLEIIPKYRVIVVEDSLELPVESMRKLRYDILRMKVRSSLLKTTTEVSAEEGIRTSLRLGDSSLIVGEVRSDEAKALYEAMRVGALANVVAGTIHGASPYGVFDRVVNDLEVPATSFKATDLIAVTNPVKSPDGLNSWKRMIQLSEVRKHWTKDPLEEKGFVDLLNYNVQKDELEPSEDLINGDSETIKNIAANVKGWAGNWDAVYDNILLRAKIKQAIVDIAEKTQRNDLLEAEFNVLSNNVFHRISNEVTKEVGIPLGERVYPRWEKFVEDYLKKKI